MRPPQEAAAEPSELQAGVAADIAWSLTHLETWCQLVIDRKWTPARFAGTPIGTMEREIFGVRHTD